MLDIKNISKKIGKTLILNDINFTVSAGHCYGLLGRNGAGKSTLLSILVGNLKQSSGDVYCLAQLMKNDTVFKEREKIGFFIDESHLIQEFTGWEYLNFIANIYNVPSNEIRNRIETLFEFLFDNKSDINQKISAYSRGMKVKLGICASLIHKPEILILDEPFAGLDPYSADKLIQLLNIYRTKSTIILSSHDLEYVEKICNLIGVLDKGKLVFNGTLQDFTLNGSKYISESLINLIKVNDYNLNELNWLL